MYSRHPFNGVVSVQVRVPAYKVRLLRVALGILPDNGFRVVNSDNAFSCEPFARIGYHDDGFLAGDSDGGIKKYHLLYTFSRLTCYTNFSLVVNRNI